MREEIRSDKGATLYIVAIALVLLMGAAALAIDLAALRLDRSADQKVTDSAASAGALAAISSGGQEACEAALAYAAINAEEVASFDASGCLSFSNSCDPTMPESWTTSAGRFTITITYPVDDNHPLMTSGQLGAPTQGVVADDGDPCERVGVEMSATHQGLFARILGFDQGTTTVHTVAISEQPMGDGVPINLLVLDRFGCETIRVHGNPGAGVIVDAVVAEDGSGLLPGVAASDSDASSGCSPVLRVDGSNGILRADGPDGCATQVGSGMVGGFVSGLGCGLIQTLAPGTPGCNPPACVAGGGNPHPIPGPTGLPGRLTRAPIDHRFNCWTDYTSPPAGVSWAADPLTAGNEQDIPGCTFGTNDHIYDLIIQVGQNGPVGGHTRWTSLGYPCNIPSSHPPILENRDIWVDCNNFSVRTDVQINGNVVFDGDVAVTSGSAHLNVSNPPGNPGWVFFRGGELSKGGQAALTFSHTAVYMSKTSEVTLTGGSGSLTWIAPNTGPFDDLALWSDSPIEHRWAGQASLTMEGVFFTPLATAVYIGGSGQNQTEAQWVADKLEAGGGGALVVKPAFGRAVEFPLAPQTILIR